MYDIVSITASDKSPKQEELDKLVCGYCREEERRSRLCWPFYMSQMCFMYSNDIHEVCIKKSVQWIYKTLSLTSQWTNVVQIRTRNIDGFTFALQVGRDFIGGRMDMLQFSVDPINFPNNLLTYDAWDLEWDTNGDIKKCYWEYSIEFMNLNFWKHEQLGWINTKDEMSNLLYLHGQNGYFLPIKHGEHLEVNVTFNVGRFNRNDEWNQGERMNAETHLKLDLTTMADKYAECVTIGTKRASTIHSALSDDHCWFIVFDPAQGTIGIRWCNRSSPQLNKIGCMVTVRIDHKSGEVDNEWDGFVLDYKDREFGAFSAVDDGSEDVVVKDLKKGKVIKMITVNIYLKSVFVGMSTGITYPKGWWKSLGIDLH